MGYASFMVPMGFIYIISPASRAAVPSIMCGFAIILGLILTLRVIPEYHREEPEIINKNNKKGESTKSRLKK